MKTNTYPEPSLKREIGVFGVASNVLNIRIGSGLFLFPAIVSGLLGNNGVLAYVLCGLLFMLIVLCYVEVSSWIPQTGGTYIYIEKAFGPNFGFLANVVFWFGVGILAKALWAANGGMRDAGCGKNGPEGAIFISLPRPLRLLGIMAVGHSLGMKGAFPHA